MAEGGGCFDKEKAMVRPKKRLEGKVVEKTGRYVYNEKATVKRQVPLRQAGWNRQGQANAGKRRGLPAGQVFDSDREDG